MGQYPLALDLYRLALTFNHEAGYRYYEIGNLIGLGLAWQRSSEPDHARHCWEQALTVCISSHDPRSEEISFRLADLEH